MVSDVSDTIQRLTPFNRINVIEGCQTRQLVRYWLDCLELPGSANEMYSPE